MNIISNKTIIGVLNRVSANHIICMDALIKADMEEKEFTDAVNHLTDNTISVASSLYGIKGVSYVNRIISKYDKQY